MCCKIALLAALTLTVHNSAVAADGGVSSSATQAQRFFVPNCRVILFGEVLAQVASEDGKLQGVLFERTADAVLINGRVWVSKDDKPKEPIRTEKLIENERRGAVMEEAARQFRAEHKKVGAASFVVGSQTYGETPQSYHVDRYDKSVTLAIKPGIAGMDYIFVRYEGAGAAEPLHPLPGPSPEEQDKVRLDNAYKGAVDDAKPWKHHPCDARGLYTVSDRQGGSVH
jgi:hypothetical protein